jgi:hypothetical protein
VVVVKEGKEKRKRNTTKKVQHFEVLVVARNKKL